MSLEVGTMGLEIGSLIRLADDNGQLAISN